MGHRIDERQLKATLDIAIPERLIQAVGSPLRGAELELTTLIEEWAVGFILPAEALVEAAPRLLMRERGWRLRARATVTPAITRFLRLAGADETVLQAIEASECGWLIDGGVLRPQGTALLLGLAAVLALEAEVGSRRPE